MAARWTRCVPGVCGCGVADAIATAMVCWLPGYLLSNPLKTEPGLCGCGVTEDAGDDDGDGVLNCMDMCRELRTLIPTATG